jgi:NAD(P)-dependent dehydrogenase (short-subunit alcohol dehydrogenase family)
MAKVTGHLGRIDILVNNAGVVRDKLPENVTHNQWTDVINTNLIGVFFVLDSQ